MSGSKQSEFEFGGAAEHTTSNPPGANAVCPRCGATELEQRHCKVVCLACGYTESCEDLCLTVPRYPQGD